MCAVTMYNVFVLLHRFSTQHTPRIVSFFVISRTTESIVSTRTCALKRI